MAEDADPGIEGDSATGTATATEPENEMGMGAFSDTPLGVSDDSPGQSGESTAAPPPAANAGAETSPDPSSAESREGGLRWDDYTRKTQEHSDNVRAHEQEKRDWHANRERDAQTAPALPAQTESAAAPDGYAQISEIAQRSGMDSDEERAARGLFEIARAGVQPEIDALKQELAGLKQFQAEFVEVKQNAAQAAEGIKSQTRERVQAQLREAMDAFGSQRVQDAVPFTQTLMDAGTINNDTGKPYTVSEATAMFHKTTIEDAKQAKTANGQVRRQARGPGVATGTTNAPGTAPGPISKSEALAVIDGTL